MAEGARAAAPPGCDAAALHPDLWGSDRGENPFRACARLREALKAALRRHLAIRADLFVLANTSQALATAVAGLALDGCALAVEPPSYPDYGALPAWPAAAAGLRAARLVTHVDPLSGAVAALPRGGGAPALVDAAQSFATLRHHAAAAGAELFIAPLHKHAGIAAGLGLLGVAPSAPFPALRALAGAAERGAAFHGALEAALAALAACGGRVVNRALVELPPGLRGALEGRGIAVLTPPGAGLPFACLRGADPASLELGGPLSAKLFPREGVLRLSAASRGRLGDPPDDLSAEAGRALARAAPIPRPDGAPR